MTILIIINKFKIILILMTVIIIIKLINLINFNNHKFIFIIVIINKYKGSIYK